jgi:hypothetical protein
MTARTFDTMATGDDIRATAEAIAARYAEAPGRETETAVAVLALWALDALDAGRLTPEEADRAFMMLDVRLGETASGPDLSDRTHHLLTEGDFLHHSGGEWGPDPGYMRRVAFAILRRPSDGEATTGSHAGSSRSGRT